MACAWRVGDFVAKGIGLAVLIGLGGCASTESMFSGIYGSSSSTPVAAATPATAETPTADATGGAPSAPIRVDFDPQADCPEITVLSGTSAYSSYAGPPAPGNVRYQASISDFARECDLNPGNTVTIKIGVQGLVLLGEKGSPGTYTVPLRIAIKDRDDKVVNSSLHNVSATVAAGAAQGSFKIIDNSIVVPINPEKPLQSYDVVIGFDEKGGGVAKPARHKKAG